MSWLAVFKFVHVTCVAVSGAGFLLRGIWMLQDSPRRHARWVRVAPHVVDSLLLASAIGLVVGLEQYPFVHAWLTAKVLGLVAYIGLGMLALHYGPSRGLRALALVAALAVFAYIVAVALTHRAAPWSA